MRLATVWFGILFALLFSALAVGGTGVWTSRGPMGAYIATFVFQPGASQVMYAGLDDPDVVDVPAVLRSMSYTNSNQADCDAWWALADGACRNTTARMEQDRQIM